MYPVSLNPASAMSLCWPIFRLCQLYGASPTSLRRHYHLPFSKVSMFILNSKKRFIRIVTGPSQAPLAPGRLPPVFLKIIDPMRINTALKTCPALTKVTQRTERDTFYVQSGRLGGEVFKQVTLVRAGPGLSAKRSHTNYVRRVPREANMPGVGLHPPSRSSSLRCSQLYMKDALASSLPSRIREFFVSSSVTTAAWTPEFVLSSGDTSRPHAGRGGIHGRRSRH